MHMVDIIRKKRDGGALTDGEIDAVVRGCADGTIPDYQLSALMMAVCFQGMTARETARLTSAMAHSGDTVDLSGVDGVTVDKHSTGGVGDKTSLVIVPIAAACGVKVAKMSGRGLGHTGGTVDKMESIPGMRTAIGREEFLAIVNRVGCAVIGQSGNLCPADKKLYALRDITSTVESIPLISSSIMSKKIAEGTGSLVLDVKVGSGAFMKDIDSARELARTLVDLGRDAGVATRALLTDMYVPLGRKIGNALEVEESVEVLAGGGPADVVELTCELARNMLDLAGVHDADVEAALRDGRAMDRWRAMIREQGGDPDAAMPRAVHTHEVCAEADGTIVGMDALSVGVASWRLGAGRAVKDDPVQAGAGIEIHAKPGETVTKGQPLLTLHTDDEWRIERALETLTGAIEISAGGTYLPLGVVLETVS